MIREYLETLNCLLKLTHRELDVLTLIVAYTYDVLHGECKPTSTIELRRMIMNNTHINKNNLSKYLSIFIDKNILRYHEADKSIVLNHSILPIVSNNEVNVYFKLIVK